MIKFLPKNNLFEVLKLFYRSVQTLSKHHNISNNITLIIQILSLIFKFQKIVYELINDIILKKKYLSKKICNKN